MKKTINNLFFSYCHANKNEVSILEKYVNDNFEANVLRDIQKIRPLDSVKDFMQSIRDADRVICLLSEDYFRSENCMYEITELIRDDTLREPFLEKVIPVVLSSKSKPLNITRFDSQNALLQYWVNEFTKVEKHLSEVETKRDQSNFQSVFIPLESKTKLRIKKIQGIVESLDTFLTAICDLLYLNYYKLLDSEYSLLYDTLFAEGFRPKSSTKTKAKSNFSRKTLQEIIDKIKPKSYADPKNPEFPYDNPRFPATDTIEVEINGKAVLVKDESSNPTGTHKDRMAWEVLLYYKRKLQSLVNSEKEVLKIPCLSMISSGSSALAIQALLNKFGLPPIKVLIRPGFKDEVYSKLKKAGCILYESDLTIRKLDRKAVLEKTDNKDGIEVSFRDAIDPAHIEYYDWLSYEILNQNPTSIIVPFGSGELFTNILNVARSEILLDKQDTRFSGDIDTIRNCKYFGVTTTNPESRYAKLCSYFFDCNEFNKEHLEMYKRLNVCNAESKVVDIDEDGFERAEELCRQLDLAVEESSLSGFAYYLQNESYFRKEERVLIVNTGRTKEVYPLVKLDKNQPLMREDLEDLAAFSERADEPEITYEELLEDLKQHGKI